MFYKANIYKASSSTFSYENKEVSNSVHLNPEVDFQSWSMANSVESNLSLLLLLHSNGRGREYNSNRALARMPGRRKEIDIH